MLVSTDIFPGIVMDVGNARVSIPPGVSPFAFL